jgi:hypothetical protein
MIQSLCVIKMPKPVQMPTNAFDLLAKMPGKTGAARSVNVGPKYWPSTGQILVKC